MFMVYPDNLYVLVSSILALAYLYRHVFFAFCALNFISHLQTCSQTTVRMNRFVFVQGHSENETLKTTNDFLQI